LSVDLLTRALKRYCKYFTVVGSAQTTKELLKLAAELQPHVAVISSNLQSDPGGGVKAVRDLRASGSRARPILLLDSSEPDLVIDAFAAGARGLVPTTSSLELLCKCIRCVHAGQIWADSNQLERVVKTLEDIGPVRLVNAKGIPLLTRREEQIVSMVAEGLPNSEISSKLSLSAHTVKNHLFHIYEKLGVSNRVELILYAISTRSTPRPPDATP
jgi:DNA-binding NarL/FixJ family response regulator